MVFFETCVDFCFALQRKTAFNWTSCSQTNLVYGNGLCHAMDTAMDEPEQEGSFQFVSALIVTYLNLLTVLSSAENHAQQVWSIGTTAQCSIQGTF